MAYTDTELDTLLNNPREVSDRPYLLFTSYALNGLRDLVVPDDAADDDYDFPDDLEMWGKQVPVKVLDRFLRELVEDFTSGSSIVMHGKNYTVRRASSIDKEKLSQVFRFPVRENMYTITKNGIVQIATEESYTKNDLHEDRTYLRKIIMLAEDDKNGGWKKLTDMEAAVYCWALFWHKRHINDIGKFQEEYNDWHGLSDKELMQGWTDKCKATGEPSGLFTFSAANIRKWNDDEGEESVIDSIPEKEADDYWFDHAINGTFK